MCYSTMSHWGDEEEMKKYLETNENVNTMIQNLFNTCLYGHLWQRKPEYTMGKTVSSINVTGKTGPLYAKSCTT